MDHKLGLDHIGHVLGPFSSRMPSKLKEMDDIINKIYWKTNDTETLILITGDHGMRDSGGHGGTTQPEVTVPLIAIGLNCQNSSFLQTDIPSNLAILLGLNIPSTSIGKIQKLFLNNLNLEEYLYALGYNTELLLKKNNICRETFVNASYFHEKFLKSRNEDHAIIAMDLYQDCSEKITRSLYEASSKQDMYSLFVAILLMLNILIILLTYLFDTNNQALYLKVPILIGTVFMQFFVSSDEIFKFFVVILASLFILQLKNLITYITLIHPSSMNIFLTFTCILHPITFISTSFIEEEHYYWIYFSVSLIILLFMQLCIQQRTLVRKNVIKVFLVLAFIRFSMDLNSTIENSVQNTDNWANILLVDENYFYHQVFFIFGLILVFFAMFNDSGISKNNYLSVISLVILFLIFLLKSNTYHNTFLGKLIWALIFLQKIFFQPYSWKHLWIYASTLLIKPHNVVLIPFALYTGSFICKLENFTNIIVLTVVSYMLSNCFYFLQGHRNSLASLDISVGYTGLNDYYPILVISQVLIHTYIFQVLFHLIALQNISKVKEQKQFWLTLLGLRTSVVLSTSTVMIVFRHHLFIWSVFAPKLFIESVHTAFLFLEVCCWYAYNYICELSKEARKLRNPWF